jgi:hypothetical protein
MDVDPSWERVPKKFACAEEAQAECAFSSPFQGAEYRDRLTTHDCQQPEPECARPRATQRVRR